MTYYCRWAVAEATSGWYKLGNDLRCSFRWAGWMGEVGGFGVVMIRDGHVEDFS
jgi:hypothetical protein